MYPDRELNRLAAHKLVLQVRITRHRASGATSAAGIAQRFAWLDRAHTLWRQLSPWLPIVAVPLGLWWKRPAAARPLGTVMRWLPVVAGVVRGLNVLRNRDSGRAR